MLRDLYVKLIAHTYRHINVERERERERERDLARAFEVGGVGLDELVRGNVFHGSHRHLTLLLRRSSLPNM
jgi:hypothetical protein